MKKKIFLIVLSFTLTKIIAGDSLSHFSAGLSLKKFAGFYMMNGLCAEFSHSRLAGEKLHLGLNLTSSVIGSAFNDHGIPVYVTEIFARYAFRQEKIFQPFLMVNTGYAKANFGSDKFKNINNFSLLISPEGGICYNFPLNVQFHASISYQLVSGNGIKGPGYIYPVCFQLRGLYVFK